MEMTKTYQYRKVTKPLLERKRRARINKCLDQLKDLMVDCLKQEGEHIVRLEKADILELTVDYLKKTKQQQTANVTKTTVDSFRNGYINAANEVSRVLASTQGVDISLGKTLMTHLGCQLGQYQQQFAAQVAHTGVAERNLTSPLCIDMPMSPASSGYHSELPSPASSESSSTSDVWRPW